MAVNQYGIPSFSRSIRAYRLVEINDDQPHIDDFESLYQNNNGWEEFCIKHKMNPIEVWYQFKNAGIFLYNVHRYWLLN